MKYDINFIKKHEACSSKVQGKNVILSEVDIACNVKVYPYKCSANVWTTGWGTAHIDKRPDWNRLQQGILVEECEKMLSDSIKNDYEKNIDSLGLKLNKNQYTAVLSLVYNVGFGAFKKSKALKHLEALLKNMEAHDEKTGINPANLYEYEIIKADMQKEWLGFTVNRDKLTHLTKEQQDRLIQNIENRRKKELDLFFKVC
jgi:GH24 family phage-related lysozyme (muramidase)